LSVTTFFQALGIGFLLAAAVGPIAILIIQRTLARGWRYGAASGLGVALADGTYGLLGGLGLAAFNQFLIDQQAPMRLIGGVVLVYLGYGIFRTDPRTANAAQPSVLGREYIGAISSIYLLTLSNPLTIMAFASVFAELGSAGPTAALAAALVFGLSVFLGSLFWWLLLIGGVAVLRERFNIALLVWLNRVSGALVVGFGLWMWWQVLGG
jgi:threonine/homoserine/homoserine lactone efflux protein